MVYSLHYRTIQTIHILDGKKVFLLGLWKKCKHGLNPSQNMNPGHMSFLKWAQIQAFTCIRVCGLFRFKYEVQNIPILPEAFLTFASKSSVGPSYVANGQEDHKTYTNLNDDWTKKRKRALWNHKRHPSGRGLISLEIHIVIWHWVTKIMPSHSKPDTSLRKMKGSIMII